MMRRFWFWRHRACDVKGPVLHIDRSARPYLAWHTWECTAHGSHWIDRGYQ